MKYICKHACIYKGVRKVADEIIEVSEQEAKSNPIIGCSFAPLEKITATETDEPDEHRMTKAMYREMLGKFGYQASPTATRDELRKMYEQLCTTETRKTK